MKRVSREQRRARLGHRHRLARPADDPGEVVTGLVAVHSSDPVTVFLSMWARVEGFRVGDLEKLLYQERSLVRHWAMRRTLWVVDRGMLPIVVSSSTNPIGLRERRRTAKMIEEGGITDDGEAWLQMAIPKTLEAIRGHGQVLTRTLSQEIPELTARLTFTNRKGRVVGTQGTISRVLVQLGLESRVIRTRPAGTWVSGQYRWAAMDVWIGGEIPDLPETKASAVLLGAWLRAYGPGTEADLKWWTGWPLRRVRQALADIEAVEVSLGDDGTGYLLADDLEDIHPPDPWVALLPSLDTTTMGWKERGWYLGDHSEMLFDRNGNAGPTVWVDGRIVGGWSQRPEGKIVYELFEDVDAEATDAIESRRDELQRWLEDVVVTPRFRSPHDRALSS